MVVATKISFSALFTPLNITIRLSSEHLSVAKRNENDILTNQKLSCRYSLNHKKEKAHLMIPVPKLSVTGELSSTA